MTLFDTIAHDAARRHNIITFDELIGLGCSPERIDWLVETQRLFRVYRGVFSVGRRDLTPEGRWLAAVVACTNGAALGRISAAVFRELLEYDTTKPQVIVPTGASEAGPTGVSLHRSNDITEEDIEVVNAIRVTTVARTLIDLSRSRLGSQPLNAAVRAAARIHKIDLQQLRGYKRLDSIVRLYDPVVGLTESDFEAIFLALCATYGLPIPEPQRRAGRRRVDFLFADARLVIECDSRQWHDNDLAFLDDRKKDRELQARGFEPLRFTWAEVVYEPKKVAAEIKAALRRRRNELRARSTV